MPGLGLDAVQQGKQQKYAVPMIYLEDYQNYTAMMADLLVLRCILDCSQHQTSRLALQGIISQLAYHHLFHNCCCWPVVKINACKKGQQILAGSHARSEMDCEDATMQMAIGARSSALIGIALLANTCLLENLPFE